MIYPLGVAEPGQVEALDGCGGGYIQPLAERGLGTQAGEDPLERLRHGRVEEKGILFIDQNFLDIRLTRRDDRLAEREILEQFERRCIGDHRGLQGDVEGGHVFRDWLTVDHPREANAVAQRQVVRQPFTSPAGPSPTTIRTAFSGASAEANQRTMRSTPASSRTKPVKPRTP